MSITLPHWLYHGSRRCGLSRLEASRSGEFGPGLYLTTFEPTAKFYALRVACGTDAPCVYRVQLARDLRLKVITKTEYIRLTLRRTPRRVNDNFTRDFDGLIGVAINGYEYQVLLFYPEDARIEDVRPIS